MTEPEEPTFTLMVLSFAKGEGDAGLVRALCEAFKFGEEEAREIIHRVPLRVKRGADRATTRQLAGQLLGMGAELCITNEQTGVEKLYYPGSGYTEDEGPASHTPHPSSRKRAEPASTPRRSADPGASMRDALRQARQRSHGEAGGSAPIHPHDGGPTSVRHHEGGPSSVRPHEAPPVSGRHPIIVTSGSSIPPPASGPISISPPTPHEHSRSTPPGAHPAPRKHAEHDAEEAAAAARKRKRRRAGVALAAVIVLGGVGVAFTSLRPALMTVEQGGHTWKASLPTGFAESDGFSTSMPTELGVARMIVRTATGSGPFRSCALGHMTFSSPPKLQPGALDRVLQHAVDELAPGGKIAGAEAVSQGKLAGRQARFAGPGGAAPFGRVRALQMASGDLAVLLIVGNAEGAADGAEATAWLLSFAPGE